MSAPAPSRKYGSLNSAFGPIPLRLDLYAHAPSSEKSGVKRSEYVKDGDSYKKVGRATVIQGTEEIIDTSRVVKLAEASDGTLVELTDEEIEAHLNVQVGGSCPIIKFLPESVFGNEYLPTGSIYQVRPVKAGSTRDGKKVKPTEAAADAKAFALTMAALKARNVFGLIEVVIKGKPRYAALRSDGRLYFVKYDDELREDLPMPEADLSDNERIKAASLVDKFFSAVPVPLEDKVTENILTYIDVKAKGEGITEQEAPVIAAPDSMDFSALLEAAL